MQFEGCHWPANSLIPSCIQRLSYKCALPVDLDRCLCLPFASPNFEESSDYSSVPAPISSIFECRFPKKMGRNLGTLGVSQIAQDIVFPRVSASGSAIPPYSNSC